jgi:hypothetical protein
LYDFLPRGDVKGVSDFSPAGVTHRLGTCTDFLERHDRDVHRALQGGLSGARALAPLLLGRIADARALRLAWDFLATRGGRAPGRNAHRYSDYSSAEVWDLCRCLATAIKQGLYRPGKEKVRWIDKGGNRGKRPLVLSNIEDRVVQRAAVLILQPVLDPLFDPRSLGYRPRLGRLHALAQAEWLTLRQQRQVWLTEDISNAFLNVPVPRLLQIARKFFPADDLMQFLEQVLPGQKLQGLRQGGPLSPLMMNLYLHHFLDRPWRIRHPHLPLIRVADDQLVLCRNEEQAQAARADLRQLLLPAGMSLKQMEETTIRDLSAGMAARWLGFTISKASRGLAFQIGDHSWTRLENYLALAHTKSDAPLRAIATLKAWLGQMGPCYLCADRDKMCERIVGLAQEQSFEEIPGSNDLRALWQSAYARWCRLRRAVREATTNSCRNADVAGATPTP